MKVRWMQANRFRALLFITLVLTGCRSARALQPDALTSPQQLSVTRLADTQESAPLGAGNAGRLAYIGGDGNVYVTTADGRSTIAITDDAEASPEQQGLSYHRIAWSPNGSLAFASVTRKGNDARGKLYVVDSPGRPAQLVAESDEHFISYIYWSPAPCPGRPDCQRLAYLIREGSDIGLHLIEIDADTVENRLLDVGRPFFFSWSGDGRRMLWHTGGDRRENPGARVTLYDVERDHVEILPHAPGSYLAPALSSVSENWLAVSSEGGQNQLKSFGPAGAATLLTTSDQEIVFSWSPTGEQVAYALRRKGVESGYGPIHVFDFKTGGTRRLTNERFRTLSFFWAPDGQRLGYLIRLDLPDRYSAQWRTIDLVSGQDRGFAAFSPSPWMWFVMSGFGQHSQSHNFWSPDGRYLVYSDRDDVLVDRVWLVDTWAERGAKPRLVAEGVIGVWSWD